MTKPPTRRESLLAGLFGTGYIGLRALATGLPPWFLLNPRRATAQDLTCMINAQNNKQYLIISTSSNGDPVNCNCPGTYENTSIIHPAVDEMSPQKVMVGGQSLGAALPWADPSVATSGGSKGQLSSAVLARTTFFHYMTGTVVHGDQPKVMKMMGATAGGEMMVSAFAKHLSACFGTVQSAPIAVGAGGNAGELVSFSGRTLPSITPSQLKTLLTGSKTDPLVGLQAQRDMDLDNLNTLIKNEYASGSVQAQFLDALSNSQGQVRSLASQLATTLGNITGNTVTDQLWAAGALIAAKVTPVVTVHIPMGGDNHSDNNLQAESDQHVSGVAAINKLTMNDTTNGVLASLGLLDQVTFAFWNVFGRNLAGISKLTASSQTGRDHWGNHNVTVLIGKNFKSAVVGGAVADSSNDGGFAASDIDSASGNAKTGGDIPAAQTMVAAARTLGAGLGIPDSVQTADWIASAGGKTVNAALTAVPAS
ncbi:MAG TPA: hypothetical protein VHG72_06190 [Polyangia bacterium]|nr:hypothetical protein [Polyangia bacterium]